jgi:hypothetical protein
VLKKVKEVYKENDKITDEERLIIAKNNQVIIKVPYLLRFSGSAERDIFKVYAYDNVEAQELLRDGKGVRLPPKEFAHWKGFKKELGVR